MCDAADESHDFHEQKAKPEAPGRMVVRAPLDGGRLHIAAIARLALWMDADTPMRSLIKCTIRSIKLILDMDHYLFDVSNI